MLPGLKSPGKRGIYEKVNAEILWAHMTVRNPYHQYPSWPGKEGLYESTITQAQRSQRKTNSINRIPGRTNRESLLLLCVLHGICVKRTY
ncbi:MAG: hypothetical protein D8M57_09045 [Candidatus Scalindua sp. AMX11]|nr:MAG: hypothetical protein DWQ00_00725 [Candidatus Scalindua sp.]TDE65180.1 MAG: hypothetical protein D8M57_09045 [Candidatus Scalindua sp. AMX11]